MPLLCEIVQNWIIFSKAAIGIKGTVSDCQCAGVTFCEFTPIFDSWVCGPTDCSYLGSLSQTDTSCPACGAVTGHHVGAGSLIRHIHTLQEDCNGEGMGMYFWGGQRCSVADFGGGYTVVCNSFLTCTCKLNVLFSVTFNSQFKNCCKIHLLCYSL